MHSPTSHPGQSSVHDTVDQLTAIASESYKKFQLHRKKIPKTCTEEAQMLSQALKDLCIKLHGLSLRCSEIDGEPCPTWADGKEAPRLRDCRATLLRIDAAFQHHSDSESTGGDQGPLSSWEMKAIQSELILHRTYVAAAQDTRSYEALAKILYTEAIPGSCGSSHSTPEKGVSLPVRISPEQMKSEVMKPFRMDDVLQRVIRHSKPEASHQFLNSAAFTRWCSEPDSILWANSPAGSSSMALAGATIRALIQDLAPNSAVCYFFSRELGVVNKKPAQLIKAIIGHLARQDVRAYEIVERRKQEPFKLRTLEGLCSTARQAFGCFDRVSLVIEGLDAYGEELSLLLGLLSSILDGPICKLGSVDSETDVRILIVSGNNQLVSNFINAPRNRYHGSSSVVGDGPVVSAGCSVEKSPKLRPMKCYLHWGFESDSASNPGSIQLPLTDNTEQLDLDILQLSRHLESRSTEW